MTIARTIAEGIGGNVGVVGFASALKTEVKERTGLDKDDPGGREELQFWGMKRRQEDPDYWVKRCEEAVQELRDEYNATVIIDDCRFPNELDWAKAQGMLDIYVDASDKTRAKRLKVSVNSDHPSESSLAPDDFSLVFLNDGDWFHSNCLYCAAREAVKAAIIEAKINSQKT